MKYFGKARQFRVWQKRSFDPRKSKRYYVFALHDASRDTMHRHIQFAVDAPCNPYIRKLVQCPDLTRCHESEIICKDKGRVGYGGALSLAGKLFTSNVYSLILGVKAQAVYFKARNANPKNSFKHTERVLIDNMFSVSDSFAIFASLTPGILCEGSNCKFAAGLDIGFNYKF